MIQLYAMKQNIRALYYTLELIKEYNLLEKFKIEIIKKSF